MDSLTRIKHTINFDKPDRVPVFSHIYGFASKLSGVSLRDYLNDGRLMALCQLEAWRKFGYDAVAAFADSCLEAETLGAKISYPHRGYPYIEEHCLARPRDCQNLCIPDPESDGRMPVVVEACKILRDQAGGETAVIATIQGPMTLAGQLMGIENLIYSAVDRPEEFCQLLDFAAEVNIAFGKALIKAGAHGVQVFDPSSSCSVINRMVFMAYVLPRLKHIFTELRKSGNPICWLSITGQTEPILDLLPQTGADLFNIDYIVPISVALEKLPHSCINGNIRPFSFISAEEGEIERDARDLLEKTQARGGFILSPGCEIPLEAKVGNIEAMIRVAKNNI